MKKFLQFLGGAVLAAGVIPYAWSKDEESGEQNFQALLWKASIRSQAEEGEKKLNVELGFNNPFRTAAEDLPAEDESDLFADEEVIVDYTPVCECTCDAECAELNDCCCGCSEESCEEPAAEPADCCEEGPCCPECCQGCCDETSDPAGETAESAE